MKKPKTIDFYTKFVYNITVLKKYNTHQERSKIMSKNKGNSNEEQNKQKDKKEEISKTLKIAETVLRIVEILLKVVLIVISLI